MLTEVREVLVASAAMVRAEPVVTPVVLVAPVAPGELVELYLWEASLARVTAISQTRAPRGVRLLLLPVEVVVMVVLVAQEE
jgi:hypothetical protein